MTQLKCYWTWKEEQNDRDLEFSSPPKQGNRTPNIWFEILPTNSYSFLEISKENLVLGQDKLLKVLLSYNLSAEQCIATESSSYVPSALGHYNK